MSWRGQGGRRAKGRRGDQDPELDSTAWLAELEREAAQADDDEDDWASTLRGRRSPATPPPAPAPDPGWPPADPEPADHHSFGMEPPGSGSGAWAPDPPPQDLPAPSPPADPDWSWRPPASDAFAEPGPEAFGDPGSGTEPDADWSLQRPSQADADWSGPPAEPADAGWQPAGADTPTGAWPPADPSGHDAGYPNGRAAPGDPATPEPGYPASEQPDYPVGREPDYPALFGELYRRSAAQQDPIWEAPPVVEPLPEAGQPPAPSGAWPFEETTQSWEPSDRSFIWPSDELPSAPAEWDQPSSAPWLDDPAPPPPAQPPPGGNGVPPPPPPVAAAGPPPADWAAAIPTDVPAARRAADPAAATGMWRPDQAADAEPGVPLGAPGGRPAARTSRAWAPADEEQATGSRVRGRPAPMEEPGEVRRKGPAPARRKRPAGERQARAWPRIVAIISWIVLVMVVCWFYVFPWLERVLPESF